jgi:septal ring factor EnvC (AmiA/AmiB activator)
MADDINKKISIDVEVNTNGQQQINQYKSSFDDLRNTINGLGQPISSLSKSINSLDTNFSKITNSTDQAKNKLTNVSSAFTAWNNTVNTLRTSFSLMNASISAGLSILIVFGPEILKWVGNMLKGNTTLSALNQTLRDHKKMLQAVNQARAQGDQNAQGELVNLKLLYNASQDHNLSLKQRKEAVAALQTQYPGYFGNISAELILTGKATNAYNDLTKAIIANARAKAAEGMLQSNSERQIRDDAQVNDLKKQLNILCQLA